MTRTLLREAGEDEATIERMIEGDLKETQVVSIPGAPTPRWLMQTLGTDWGREIIEDSIWVDLAFDKIGRALGKGKSVVVDDLRFPNELIALNNEFDEFVFVKVSRPGEQSNPGDRYEGQLAKFPPAFHIINDAGLETLRERTRDMVAFLRAE